MFNETLRYRYNRFQYRLTWNRGTLFFIFFPFCYLLQANSYPRSWVTIEVAVYILEPRAEADYSLKAFNTSPMNSSGFQAPGPEGGIHAPR